jgi:hypothetical protein
MHFVRDTPNIGFPTPGVLVMIIGRIVFLKRISQRSDRMAWPYDDFRGCDRNFFTPSISFTPKKSYTCVSHRQWSFKPLSPPPAKQRDFYRPLSAADHAPASFSTRFPTKHPLYCCEPAPWPFVDAPSSFTLAASTACLSVVPSCTASALLIPYCLWHVRDGRHPRRRRNNGA